MENTECIYDVIIIGAGIAGASVARELSKYELKVALLEKEADVCFGATKGTHSIVHCGIPGNRHTPLRNRGEIIGNLMMEQLCSELDVPFQRIGKMVVAFNEKELGELKKVEEKSRRNGVIDLETITDQARIKRMEPNISDDVIAVLYTKNTAVSSPWGLVIGLCENAVANGVELFVNTCVQKITVDKEQHFTVQTNKGCFKTNYVVNAAGIYADNVAGLIGDDSFIISGTRQQRMIMDKKCKGIVEHLVRYLDKGSPTGDFICPTVYDDLIVGSKVEETEYKGDVATTREGLEEWLVPHCLRLVPILGPSNCIKPFAGFIPKAMGENATGDYWIKPFPKHPRFINMVLGSSGFSASPAMAEYVALEILPYVGLKLREKKDFNPIRKDIPHINEISNKKIAELINKDPRYGRVICRCETVSEGEIVEAIKRGATTRDGIKFRTRAGMGRCQGGFCGPRVLKILSRELNKPLSEITRKGEGSIEAPYKTKDLLNGTKESRQ